MSMVLAMRTLSGREGKILGALAAALLPPTAQLPETTESVGVVGRVGHHLSYYSENLRVAFRLTLHLFEWGAFFFRGRPFTRLRPDQQERYLELWRGFPLYPIRLLHRLLESACFLNYYSDLAINRKIGFEPPPIRHRTTPPPHTGPLDRDLSLKTEVCVIGSGAGGGTVAKELAEKGRGVIVLEEGGYATINDFGREPLEIVQKLYRSAALQVTLGLPSILLPTGRAVGGTTVINSGTCLRLPDPVLERWRQEFGLDDLSPEVLRPYFDKVEDELHVEPVGEAILGKNAELVRRGLKALGREGRPLTRDVRDCRGAGMCCFGCPNDAKQAMQLSYLPRAIAKGARLFTGARVTQIFPKGGHGVDVVAVSGGHRIHVEARVAVIAAGTLVTPHLLRWNQIVLHNRHVGRHLTIHPACKVSALFEEEVRGWVGVPQGYVFQGVEGLLFEGVFTPPSFGSISLNLPHRLHKEVMENYAHLASFGFMVTDQGRGWIRWLPNGDPIIYYSIRLHEVEKFIQGIRFLAEVFFAAGATKVLTGLHRHPVLTRDEGVGPLDRVRFRRTDLSLAAFHPLGTCRMGSDPALSVVDSFGEVHGIRNLFVADGSIFPTPLGVNPQETIMAFATRTAEQIDRCRL